MEGTSNKGAILDNLKNRFQLNPTTQMWENTNQTVNGSMGDVINSETDTVRNMQLEKAINLLNNKHQVRLQMASGGISSGDRNTDKLENARSKLADYARAAYIEEAKKDSSVDLSVLDRMKDQDIIDWMTKDDPDAQQTYIDFINKGGFVKDAYNKIMGIDEEAIKQAEREESGTLKNFVGAGLQYIGNQVAGASDLLGITDFANSLDKKQLEPYLNVSNDEYERYKNGEISKDELKKKGVLAVYNDYESDTDRGDYLGDVESYGKAMYDREVGRTEQTAQEQLAKNWVDEFGYNPEGEGAEAGRKVTEFAEFLTMPNSKLGWLKNTLLGTAEILGIDILNKGKNNSLGELGEDALFTTGLNAALEGILHIPGGVKWLRDLIGKTSPEIKQSLEKISLDLWKDANKVADKGLAATKKKASEYIDKAAKGIAQRINGIGNKLQETRDKLVNIGKEKFGYNDLFGSINDSFKTFEEKGWGKNSAPEIKIDKAGNMSIYNEDALSSVTDSEGVKVLDYIKNEWNAFRNQGRSENAGSVEKFMRDIKTKIDKAVESGKIDGKSEAVLKIKEGINAAYEKLYKVADEFQRGLGKDFKEQRKQYNRTQNYYNFFDKYIGAIKNGKAGDKLMGELKDLEKNIEWGEKGVQKGEDIIGKFFNILRKDKVIDEDIGSKLVSLIYAFSLKNKGQLKDLIETIYPSIPGLEEAGLDIFRRKARASAAKSTIKQGAKNRAKQEANNAKRQLEKSGYIPTIWDKIGDSLQSAKDTIVSGIKKSPRAGGYTAIEEGNQ